MKEKTPDANEILREHGVDVLRDKFDRAVAEPKDPIIVKLDGARGKAIQPLALVRANSFEGQPIPDRVWVSDGRIPAANVSLLGGDGAVGKTLLALMLSVAVVCKIDWLGKPILKTGPVIFFSAEEDQDELHRRLKVIISHEGIQFSDLSDLHLYCCPGEDGTLGRPVRPGGAITKTPLFDRLYLSAITIKPALIVIETSADVFGGNEIDRSQVRQFVALLRHMAIGSEAAVLLLAHPSVAGKTSGDGTSGSTGWNNSVRSRMYFRTVKKDDTLQSADDIREFEVMKANYSKKGEIVRVRWERGVFVPHGELSPQERAAEDGKIDEIFLNCLDLKAAQGMEVGPNPSSNYAPAKFAAMSEAQGLSVEAFKKSMNRLLDKQRIKLHRNSKKRDVIVRGQQVLKLVTGDGSE